MIRSNAMKGSVITGAVVIDSANFDRMRKALGVRIDFRYLPVDLEHFFYEQTGQQVALQDWIVVGPPVDLAHPNVDGILRFRVALQKLGWRHEEPPQVRRHCPNCSTDLPKGEDDQLMMTILVEQAVKHDVLVLGTGDGDFVRLIKSLKLFKPHLIAAVVTAHTDAIGFRSSFELRSSVDVFVEVAELPCCYAN